MTPNEIPAIDQHTIECDLRAFTHWLNELKDQVNYLSKIYVELKSQVEDHEYRIHELENRMDTAETAISDLNGRINALDLRVAALENSGTGGVIEMLSGRVDMLYSWLPIPYGMIDPKGWKFAMGNVNAMTNQTNPTDVEGPGIYTRGEVGNNDVTFN